MLKKHNKLIMLLVLVTFMFTMVGSAGAATFSDVSGTSVEAQAIYRLNGLGVLDGYPDGTFGPEKTITRAEFAKIACVTAGLKAVASGMGGTASPFSDVAADHWANGWINVAAAQGFVKGDPAGTFRPEDKITQAEVVTVLLRLLGYNDNLPGEWPSDYIAKAANLGVLDDVTFVANQAATRGTVAILASATLDENVVEYAASDNLFNEATKNGKTYTLLFDKFNKANKTEDALIMSFSLNDDEYTIYYYLYDKDGKIIDANPGTYNDTTKTWSDPAIDPYTAKLAANCTLPGGSVLNAIEAFADFTTDKDGKVTSITLKDYKKFGPKTAAGTPLNEIVIDGGKVKIDGVKYNFAKTAIVTEACNTEFSSATQAAIGALGKKVVGGTEVAADWNAVKDAYYANTIDAKTIADATYDKSDAYAVIMNEDNEVAALRAFTFPTAGIVKKVNGEKVTYQSSATPVQAKSPLKASIAAAFGLTTAQVEALMTKAGVATTIFDKVQSNSGAWDGFANTNNFTDKDIYVQKDGKPATLKDLAENDTLSVLENYRGCDYYLVASSTKITGKLASAKYDGGNVKSVSVMGMTWKAPWSNLTKTSYQGRYTSDTKDYQYATLTQNVLSNEYDVWNTDVTLLLSATGKVVGLMLGDTGGTSMYGVVTDWSGDITAANGDAVQNITIMKADGKEYTYALGVDSYLQDEATNVRTKVKDLAGSRKDDYDAAKAALMPASAGGVFTNGILVSVSLDSNNIIKTVKYWNQGSTAVAGGNMDTDKDLFRIGTVWYDAADVVVFNLVGTDLGDTTALGWKELKQAAGEKYFAYYTNSSNKLEYIVIPTTKANALASDIKYAIYQEQYSDADDWIKLVGMDAFKVDAFVGGLTKGDVVSYKLSGGKATAVTQVLAYKSKAGNVTVDTINKGIIKFTDNSSVKIDANDTVYLYNADDKKLQVLEGVAEGDVVVVFKDKDDVALAIVVVE